LQDSNGDAPATSKVFSIASIVLPPGALTIYYGEEPGIDGRIHFGLENQVRTRPGKINLVSVWGGDWQRRESPSPPD
jgi:hypothetical protein